MSNSSPDVILSDEDKQTVFENSRSQLGQDVLALALAEHARGGFFVEFGATDGVHLSNTFLLESQFGWRGILSEPARKWHEKLKSNRTATIDHRCVYSVTGSKLKFVETEIGELSTIHGFGESDGLASSREGAENYEVESVSLEDLLRCHSAPRHIDFLSVDTEGSEFEILNAFDFSTYSFGLIAVEHNYTKSRDKVFELLSANGYTRIHESLSDFDDWYVQGNN
jgi:FkbM family methyltransferase